MKKYFTPILVTVLALFGVIAFNQTAGAADMSKFNAGNIMSDYVMSNKNSMTEAQIQAFLTKKNPCNNSNLSLIKGYEHLGFNIKDGKFVCLSKETFNGETAARIIWQAAQDYNINPQVLIVLLEKEQRLVTDTYPNQNIQYRNATGYGCPDKAPCDAKYFGFKNQVRNAANFFRAHLDNNPCWNKPHTPGTAKAYWKPEDNCNGWGASNDGVQYHPNTSCGATKINIENRATSGLYSYTPYRPNQAALNAGYGTGDGCSSYGNRNFWAYFNDWFGSTHAQVSFERMETPRHLSPSISGIRKINLNTFSPTDNPLHDEQLIYFTGRTIYNNQWCLRSQHDRDLGNNYCVPFSQLSEVSVTQIEIPRKKVKITNGASVKINPITKETLDVLSKGQHLSVSKKATFNGVEYYITTHDVENGQPFAIKTTDTEAVNMSITPIPEATFSIKTLDNVYKTDIWSHNTAHHLAPLSLGQKIAFKATATVDGETYYLSKHDIENSNSNYGIKERYLNKNIYTPYATPQSVVMNATTCKYNLDTSSFTNLCYSPGTTLVVKDRLVKNDETYYRTAWESEHNTNLVITVAPNN